MNRSRSVTALVALVERDLLVLSRQIPSFLIRVIIQPALFIFVFAYVFPKIGQGIGGEAGSKTFSTLLIPGTIALASFFNGIQSVGIPMIGDLGFSLEIEDRIGAPISVRLIALAKTVAASIEGILAGIVVFPIAFLVPSTGVSLRIDPPLLVVAVVVTAVLGSAFGLLLGVTIRPQHIPLMFSLVVVPFTFLGASYYPWRALDSVPVLRTLILVNPLVYSNELLRAAMSPQIPHLAVAISLGGCLAFCAGLYFVGTQLLERRLHA